MYSNEVSSALKEAQRLLRCPTRGKGRGKHNFKSICFDTLSSCLPSRCTKFACARPATRRNILKCLREAPPHLADDEEADFFLQSAKEGPGVESKNQNEKFLGSI